jgi:hypothetical protein
VQSGIRYLTRSRRAYEFVFFAARNMASAAPIFDG